MICFEIEAEAGSREVLEGSDIYKGDDQDEWDKPVGASEALVLSFIKILFDMVV